MSEVRKVILKYVFADLRPRMCMFRSVQEISEFMSERAIITPLNEDAESLNDEILRSIPFQLLRSVSIDAVSEDTPDSVPAEILHGINPPGFPPHILGIKKPSCVTLLRNLNLAEGLSNGTRLLVMEARPRTGASNFPIVLTAENGLACTIACGRGVVSSQVCLESEARGIHLLIDGAPW